MRPDSSAVVNGVIAKLGADAELLALVPNGIYEDLGPPNAKRFVVVSQILATDTATLHQGRVIEDALLLVEARVLSSSGGNAAAAAARIDALLDDGALEVPGYRVSALFREEFVRGTEVDEVDPTIVWKRRGGRYRVTAYREIVASAVGAQLAAPAQGGGFGALQFWIWFDGPLKIPSYIPGQSFPEIRLVVAASNPLLVPNTISCQIRPEFSPPLVPGSVYDVPPPAPGRAKLYFQGGADMTGWAGETFVVSDASIRQHWDLILNRESGEPVADTLGDVVLTIPILP